jgi:hypothetical protein
MESFFGYLMALIVFCVIFYVILDITYTLVGKYRLRKYRSENDKGRPAKRSD